jgi:hypothetical protein
VWVGHSCPTLLTFVIQKNGSRPVCPLFPTSPKTAQKWAARQTALNFWVEQRFSAAVQASNTKVGFSR